MSATLGVLLKKLMPDATISIYEKLDKVAAESSYSWNNAGTGHSAFCELNYTPEQKDGSLKLDKALEIASAFEISKQFWAHLKAENQLPQDKSFIKNVPHLSFVWGEENINFLKKRHKSMTPYALFEDMQISEDFDEIARWVPLMMQNRDRNERIGVTRMHAGTDVNFDAITKGMINYLTSCDGVELHMLHKVKNLNKQKDGSWKLKVKDLSTGKTKNQQSQFIFIGAGGGALPLLQKSGIKEGKGYGGFPVSGLFLRCKNPDVIAQHHSKVYGKAAEGSPPMSMPHLDKRIINGEHSLMFGPYAGFSSKFLKSGSYFDLFLSLRLHNIWPMMAAGMHNIPLTKYLVTEVFKSFKKRFKVLQKYYPEAQMQDWELIVAGQRVQIMKKNKKEGGVLKLGTEIINNSEGSLVALLGASPGASTSVSIMLDVLHRCFPEQMHSEEWKTKLKEMIPSYGLSLIDDPMFCKNMRTTADKELELIE